MTKIMLDAHFDVLNDVLYYRKRGEDKVLENRFLHQFRECGLNVIVCSLFVDDIYVPEGALRNALDQAAALSCELEESPDFFALCRSASEARKAVGDGKIALFLSLEGADPLGCDLLLLRTFYDLGVRLLGLTWSRRNYAADGSTFEPRKAPKTEGGLTMFGRDLLCEAQRLGMVIDVSHLNDAGFFEAAERIKGPFIASHSDCRALCSAARNLTDEQLKILAESGGVTGMNACAMFSSDVKAERTPDRLLKHLDHVVKTVGWQHAGIGFDLCQCLKAFVVEQEDDDTGGDLFIDHAEAYKKFVVPVRSKYPENVADAILGENFMRVLEKVLG